MSSIEMIPFTKEGKDRLEKELDDLKSVQRPAVIEAIAEAREHGDLKENAEYHAAREKQGFIEGRISDLEDKLSRAQVVEPPEDGTTSVRFGATVKLEDLDSGEERSYQIVGDLEADIEKNRVSISSPIAKALLGKNQDDEVTIKVPSGRKEYVILGVHYTS